MLSGTGRHAQSSAPHKQTWKSDIAHAVGLRQYWFVQKQPATAFQSRLISATGMVRVLEQERSREKGLQYPLIVFNNRGSESAGTPLRQGYLAH